MSSAVIEELDKHLRLAREADPDATIFAYWDERNREFPASMEIDGRRWRLVRARSELAIRAAMLERAEDELLAIVTPLTNGELAHDVRARIAGHKLLEFNPWDSLLGLFVAHAVDGRLLRNLPLGWALLRRSTIGGFRPSQTGVLQEQEAWGAYFAHALGMDSEPVEIEGWVRWFMDNPSVAADLVQSDDDLYQDVISRARSRCGDAVVLLFRATAIAVSDQVDLGLRLHTIAHAATAAFSAPHGSTSATVAAGFLVRLEKYFGGSAVDEDELKMLAGEILRTDPGSRNVAKALDEMLGEGKSIELGIWSDISDAGYRARRRELATHTLAALNDPSARELAILALERVQKHRRFSAEDAAHRNRVAALVRLAGRLGVAGATSHPIYAADLIREYVEDGSFIDWLRETLEQGDLGTDFNDVVSVVLATALEHSSARNAHFARSLVSDLETTGHVSGAFFVHQMIREVLAPLAKARPVLVLVVDGLSWFALRQLSADPTFEAWNALVPAKSDRHQPMLATFPSVTNFSRTSLLTGELQVGKQHAERKGFAKEPHLVAQMRNKHRAVLFHQGELDEMGRGIVGPQVAAALRSRNNRVVGVILNAVDDQLGGASQLAFDWSVEALAPLRSLLELADETERDVLIVSDHGHIWETGTAKITSGESARYRMMPPEPEDGEIAVSGSMVEAFGATRLVAAYDERIRYTAGKRGYHGGVSIQEIAAPCLLLSKQETPDPHRWRAISFQPPAWWDFRKQERAVQPSIGASLSKPVSTPNQQLSLVAPIEPTNDPKVPEWLSQLLESEPFLSQWQSMRSAPSLDSVAAVLATLEANKNRAHLNTLAEATGLTVTRLTRLMTAMQRILNLEGFRILEHIRGEQVVKLDRDLLIRQFRLEESDES